MFILYANKNQLTVRKREPVTSGSVNVYRVRFDFSDDWDGMSRTAIFRAGVESRAVLLEEDNETVIPWEVLKEPNVQLYCGIYGSVCSRMVLPTIWTNLGIIMEGVPGDSPGTQPPTPDLWEQELAKKGDALSYDGLTLGLKSGDKVLSSVEIAGGGGGVVYLFGHGLKQDGLDVSVDAVSDFSGDNTLPMTAAGVQTQVGNIEALLATI